MFEHNENWGIEEDITGNDIYRVIKCQDCSNVSYRTDSSNLDDVEYYDDGSFVPIVQTSYYPPSIIGYGQIKNKYQLPSIVRTIYEETISAIANNNLLLAGIGLRTMIEAICNKERISGTNLVIKIDKLKTNGYISKIDASYLHGIRFMGNDATHSMETPKKEQVILAINVIEHLLETLYIYKNTAIELLDTIIDEYKDFITLVNIRICKLKDNESFTLEQLLEKDKRRIVKEKIDEFFTRCKEDIDNGLIREIKKKDDVNNTFIKIDYFAEIMK